MQTAATVVVGILCLLFVGGFWVLNKKVIGLILGQASGPPRQELLGIGIRAAFCAAVLGLAVGIAWLTEYGGVGSGQTKFTGTVTVAGKALAGGRLYFHSSDGRNVDCEVRDGRYAAELAPGGYAVTVEGEGVSSEYKDIKTSHLTVEVNGEDAGFNFDLLGSGP